MLNFESPKDAASFVKGNDVQQIDIKFTNLFGGLHHITIPASRLSRKTFEEGIGFDGSSIPGFASIEKSDMVVIPDLKRSFIDPFYKIKTLSFIGSTFEAADKKEFALDPRAIASKAERLLSKMNFANRSLWGPEYEFYVFNSVNYQNEENVCFYEVDSEEAHWNSLNEESANRGYSIKKGKGYHTVPPKDKLYNYRSELSAHLENIGIEVKYHHHEGGGAGQVELEVQMKELLQSGDQGQLIKYFAKMVAYESGFTVTFMPKPLFNEAGSGMHFHQMLFKDDAPIFYENGSQPFELSKIALNYIGGILHHSSSLLGITNPSTNSYKRLMPGFEAPIKACFSLSNRKAAIRIPAYATLPVEKRIEFRPPDATGNIYLSLSAMLLAGLDGIEKSIDPIKEGFDSFETGKLLPASLENSIKALKDDNSYLLKDNVFTDDCLKNWIAEKEKELEELNSRVHPYEIELYYDC